ncbi:DUF664 domain-containing protein [Streptomyces sp. T1317-0309]|nr:DUF664 domain-containing protein [Streptomyces sp. T1317-0309]
MPPDARWWTHACEGHPHRRLQPHPGRSPCAVDGLGPDELNARPVEDANSIAWLVWHLTRVQDDHVADAASLEQVWLSQGWEKRFGLGLPARTRGTDTAPGRSPASRWNRATCYRLLRRRARADARVRAGLTAKDFERIVDERWDPPVSLGVRLVSVLSDDLQHAGQAAYVRGLLQSAAS